MKFLSHLAVLLQLLPLVAALKIAAVQEQDGGVIEEGKEEKQGSYLRKRRKYAALGLSSVRAQKVAKINAHTLGNYNTVEVDEKRKDFFLRNGNVAKEGNTVAMYGSMTNLLAKHKHKGTVPDEGNASVSDAAEALIIKQLEAIASQNAHLLATFDAPEVQEERKKLMRSYLLAQEDMATKDDQGNFGSVTSLLAAHRIGPERVTTASSSAADDKIDESLVLLNERGAQTISEQNAHLLSMHDTPEAEKGRKKLLHEHLIAPNDLAMAEEGEMFGSMTALLARVKKTTSLDDARAKTIAERNAHVLATYGTPEAEERRKELIQNLAVPHEATLAAEREGQGKANVHHKPFGSMTAVLLAAGHNGDSDGEDTATTSAAPVDQIVPFEGLSARTTMTQRQLPGN